MSVSLVLQGGGIRGWYTSGVLTALREENIEFRKVYGVSAGALCAIPYISGQLSRKTAAAYVKNLRDRRFMSVGNLRRTGSYFGFDYMLEELPRRLPFDYRTFFSSPVELEVGTTDLKTGRAVYFGKDELKKSLAPLRASCSLPFFANIVEYRDYALLDGGCVEPIPIDQPLRDGSEKNVIVLTRVGSYREKRGSRLSDAMLSRKYGQYPNFVNSMERHFQTYNREVDLCSRLERQGRAVVIRPRGRVGVRRYRDTERMMQMYRMGIRDCREKLPLIRRFVS